MLPDAMCGAVRAYAVELAGGSIPDYYSIDTIIDYCRDKSPEMWAMLSVDSFLLGYSAQNKSIGVASVWSYQDYKMQEIYKPGFVYFLKKDPLKKIGKKPETKQEMADAMRAVFAYEKKKHKGNTIIGGGNIDLTIVQQNGSFDFEDLGPIEPQLSLVPTTAGNKVGRNDPCPCGSGKKYKKCCGQ